MFLHIQSLVFSFFELFLSLDRRLHVRRQICCGRRHWSLSRWLLDNGRLKALLFSNFTVLFFLTKNAQKPRLDPESSGEWEGLELGASVAGEVEIVVVSGKMEFWFEEKLALIPVTFSVVTSAVVLGFVVVSKKAVAFFSSSSWIFFLFNSSSFCLFSRSICFLILSNLLASLLSCCFLRCIARRLRWRSRALCN